MSDPLQSFLGIKISSLAAGFAGGLVRSLMMPGVTRSQAFVACIIGAVTAGYLTPIAIHYWPLEKAEGTEGAIGFLLGLTSMLIVEGVLRAAKRWRDEPTMPPKG